MVVMVSVVIEPDVHATSERPEGDVLGAERQQAPLGSGRRFSLRPYKGLGTWVDIYDEKLWDDPEAAVLKMKEKGVQTVFLQSANYRVKRPMFRAKVQARFIEAAHLSGIDVVAWYLPAFSKLDRDFRHAKAALRFRTDTGKRFDSFALDIEATVVQDIDKRNRRMFKLTRRIREVAGSTSLAAITPDPIGSLYWPDFPYRKVGNHYDVMMPMGYFTYRTSGAKKVGRHVAAGIEAIRERTDTRIHYIGGLSGEATRLEVRSYVRRIENRDILGGGLYDFAGTRAGQWEELRRLRRLRP
jgi:hypothetical protein